MPRIDFSINDDDDTDDGNDNDDDGGGKDCKYGILKAKKSAESAFQSQKICGKSA